MKNIMFYGFALFLLVNFSVKANATEALSGPFEAEVLEVIDGDTISVAVHIWLDQKIITHIRLLDIDTPELRGGCEAEREMAINARERLIELIDAQPVILTDIRYGRFAGRVLGQITLANGQNASQALLREELARPYDGGRREGWCS